MNTNIGSGQANMNKIIDADEENMDIDDSEKVDNLSALLKDRNCRSESETFYINLLLNEYKDIKENYSCKCCDGILWPAYAVHGCGHELCEKCINNKYENESLCNIEGCRNSICLFGKKSYSPIFYVKNAFDEISLNCIFCKNYGSPINNLISHMESCASSTITYKCRYMCGYEDTNNKLITHEQTCILRCFGSFQSNIISRFNTIKLKQDHIKQDINDIDEYFKYEKHRTCQLLIKYTLSKKGLLKKRKEDSKVVVTVTGLSNEINELVFKIQRWNYLAVLIHNLKVRMNRCIILTAYAPLGHGSARIMHVHDSIGDFYPRKMRIKLYGSVI